MKTSKNAHRVTATEQLKNVATKPQHTQGEWKYKQDSTNSVLIFSTDSEYIAEIVLQEESVENMFDAKANAQRIVTCVNEYEALKKKADMHDELVEVLKIALSNLKEGAISTKDMIEQLLKQAERK